MIKQHLTPLHELMNTYKIEPKKMEKIEVARLDPKWEARIVMRIAELKEAAMRDDERDWADIKIYTDGSGLEGSIGAAAVLYRNGRLQSKLRYRLGMTKKHLVYEGEGVGMVLGLELLRGQQNVSTVSIGIDNQATIVATGLIWPAPSHHVWDILHKRLDMVKRMHRDMALTIRWTPGHMGIAGNEAADVEVKEASQTGSSPANRLPAPLRHTLPHSKSAAV
jgi:ribonuclease HI